MSDSLEKLHEAVEEFISIQRAYDDLEYRSEMVDLDIEDAWNDLDESEKEEAKKLLIANGIDPDWIKMMLH